MRCRRDPLLSKPIYVGPNPKMFTKDDFAPGQVWRGRMSTIVIKEVTDRRLIYYVHGGDPEDTGSMSLPFPAFTQWVTERATDLEESA